MSDKAAALLARLTDKPMRYDEPTGGTPGTGLTPEDIAGALSMGGAAEVEELLVRCKWVQDRSVQDRLFYRIYDAVVDLACRQRWEIPRGQERLRVLTRVAILEVVDPNCCPTCQGRKEVWPRGKNAPEQCHTCHGIGRRTWTDSMRYRLAGVDKKTWARTKAKYTDILALVRQYEDNGLRAVLVGLG